MDTIVYKLTDQDDIQFFWENPRIELDFVFRPSIDALFSPTAFDNLEKGNQWNTPFYYTRRITSRIRHTQLQYPRDITSPCVAAKSPIWN